MPSPARCACLLLPALLLSACASTPTAKATRQKTDRELDLAIDGPGFFMVQTPAGGFLFTRNGSLSVSATGEIVNNDGFKLFPTIRVPSETNNIIVAPDGEVRTQHAGQIPELAGQIVLSRFKDNSRLRRDGIYYMPADDDSELPITGAPGRKGIGTLVTGAIETP